MVAGSVTELVVWEATGEGELRIAEVDGVVRSVSLEMGLDGLQAGSKRIKNIAMLKDFTNFACICTPSIHPG
jgi:hypothetical protein